MSIKYIKGDLLTSDADVIAHGVNCTGAFGSGVAGQIRRKWPEVYRAYLTKHDSPGWKLGDVQLVDLEDSTQKVANLATQQGYGYKAGQEVYVNYHAVFLTLRSLIHHCHKRHLSIAMPKVGAGLAGGDWNKIEKIIEDLLIETPVDLSVYTLD